MRSNPRSISFFLCLLAVAAVIATTAGCSSGGNGDAATNAAAEAAPVPPPPPTAAEQILEFEASCAANADAIAARQAEASLYDRLGGTERIHAIVAEVIRLHGENPQISRTLEGVDQANLIDKVTEFIAAGSGGPGEYTGRTLPESHAHLQLTNADFLAAGGDIMQGMRNLGCGEDEIQEMMCMFLPLRDQVVIESDRAL